VDAICVICHDRPASFRCLECHKPVCDECAFKAAEGAFCSRNCATRYRDFKMSQAPAARGRSGSLLKTLILLIALAAVALGIAWWKGWLPESWKARVEQKATQLKEKVEQKAEEFK